MDDKKDQFYFEGKYLDNEDDFWKWVYNWANLPLDQETAERLFDTHKKEVIMNIFLRDVKFSNFEFRQYLNNIFAFSMNELPKNNDWINDK